MDDICRKYDEIAEWFDGQRNGNNGDLMEKEYLGRIAEGLPAGGHVLDWGCGTGEPIAGRFIRAGHRVTGIDGSPAMISKCRDRFPEMTWQVAEFADAEIEGQFDALIAWDSTFHLAAEAQRGMFVKWEKLVRPGGFLLFTSGPDAGEITGEMQGRQFCYASLSAEEYRGLLEQHGFEVLMHRVEDPNCGRHTVWLARRVGL